MNRGPHLNIIIGLCGSGKSTLIPSIVKTQRYFAFSDWGCEHTFSNNGEVEGSFKDGQFFDLLIEKIKGGWEVVLEGIAFCDHRFLCEAEYELNVRFPDIQIHRYYLENNIKAADANVWYRTHKAGAYFYFEGEQPIFVGPHHVERKGKRVYEISHDLSKIFTKNYIIPSSYDPIPIHVVDEKYYEGWRALLKE